MLTVRKKYQAYFYLVLCIQCKQIYTRSWGAHSKYSEGKGGLKFKKFFFHGFFSLSLPPPPPPFFMSQVPSSLQIMDLWQKIILSIRHMYLHLLNVVNSVDTASVVSMNDNCEYYCTVLWICNFLQNNFLC